MNRDLRSPDLSGESQWQERTGLSYDVTGEFMKPDYDLFGRLRKAHVGFVLKAEVDGSETTYWKEKLHEITPKFGDWQTYTVDFKELEVPEGITVVQFIFQLGFEASRYAWHRDDWEVDDPAVYDGYIMIDNVTSLTGDNP